MKDRHNTAEYFMNRILPETSMLLKRMRFGSGTMMKSITLKLTFIKMPS
jgi:hypothetical protein